jgi:phage tail-like protein
MALRDPYRNFKFEVEIDGFTRAGFQKIGGLKHSVEVIEYREGGTNETTLKMPGQSSFDAVTFERGKSDDTDFLTWIQSIFSLDNADGAQGTEDYRKDVTIYLKDKAGSQVVKWTLYNCWPSEMSSSDLDATGNDVVIETLVLQNEGIKEEKV